MPDFVCSYIKIYQVVHEIIHVRKVNLGGLLKLWSLLLLKYHPIYGVNCLVESVTIGNIVKCQVPDH
jgi:hypothetical protein